MLWGIQNQLQFYFASTFGLTSPSAWCVPQITKSQKNKTENHFSHYPRSQVDISSYTRLNIATSLNCGKSNKLPVKAWSNWTKNKFKSVKKAGRACSLVTCGDCEASERAHQIWSKLVELPGRVLPGNAAGQGCLAMLLDKAAGQGCRARLPGKTAVHGCRARLPV
jgi:hypothetical protein